MMYEASAEDDTISHSLRHAALSASQLTKCAQVRAQVFVKYLTSLRVNAGLINLQDPLGRIQLLESLFTKTLRIREEFLSRFGKK